MINVQQWGIVGDGETDNFENMVLLMEHLNSVGGGQLFFPHGVYLMNGYVPLFSNVSICGVYGQSVIKQTDFSTDIIRNLDGPIDNVSIKNIVFRGTSPGEEESTRVVLNIYGHSTGYNENININDCIFESDLRAIKASKCKDINIRNNKFIPIDGGAPACWVTCGDDGVLSDGVSIHGNVFKPFGAGKTQAGSPAYTNAQPIGCEASNLKVYNNTIEGWTYNGITSEILEAENISIYDNDIKATPGYSSTGAGIFSRCKKDISIHNNKVVGKSDSDAGILVTLNGSDIPQVGDVFDNVNIRDNEVMKTSIGVQLFSHVTWVGPQYTLKSTVIKNNVFSDITGNTVIANTDGFDCSEMSLTVKGNISQDDNAITNVSVGSGAKVSFTENDSMGLLATGPSDSQLMLKANSHTNGFSVHLGTLSSFTGKINDGDSVVIYGKDVVLNGASTVDLSGELSENATYLLTEYGCVYAEQSDDNTGIRVDAKLTKNDGTTLLAKALTTEINKPLYSKTESGSGGRFATGTDYTGVVFCSVGGKVGTGRIKPYIRFLRIL